MAIIIVEVVKRRSLLSRDVHAYSLNSRLRKSSSSDLCKPCWTYLVKPSFSLSSSIQIASILSAILVNRLTGALLLSARNMMVVTALGHGEIYSCWKIFTSLAALTREIFLQQLKRNFVFPRGHVISLNNINVFSVREVTRMKDIITQHEFRW